jgi:UDP-MurNAc hydroxylase
LDRLTEAHRSGVLVIPGTTVSTTNGAVDVAHPCSDDDVAAIFTEKASYLEQYQHDWLPWIDAKVASWHEPTDDLLTTLQAWWEPLLAIAPTLRVAVGGVCVIDMGELVVAIDFPAGTVGEWDGSEPQFRFTIDRRLVETVVAERAVDWSNSLFLSCRFTAWRAGPFNEYVYNFFKSLSVERMRRTEAEAVRRADPERGGIADEEIRIGDWIVQRTCPHRDADLAVFGEIDGDELVCTLHGWRFECRTGRCLNAEERTLRIRHAD